MATTVTFADKADPDSVPGTLALAEANLVLASSEEEVAEAVMDKGYHDDGLLPDLVEQAIRTYVPERRKRAGAGPTNRKRMIRPFVPVADGCAVTKSGA